MNTLDVVFAVALPVFGVAGGMRTAGRFRDTAAVIVAIGSGLSVAMVALFAADGDAITGLLVGAVYGVAFAIGTRLAQPHRRPTDDDLRQVLDGLQVTADQGNAVDPARAKVMPPEMEREPRRTEKPVANESQVQRALIDACSGLAQRVTELIVADDLPRSFHVDTKGAAGDPTRRYRLREVSWREGSGWRYLRHRHCALVLAVQFGLDQTVHTRALWDPRDPARTWTPGETLWGVSEGAWLGDLRMAEIEHLTYFATDAQDLVADLRASTFTADEDLGDETRLRSALEQAHSALDRV